MKPEPLKNKRLVVSLDLMTQKIEFWEDKDGDYFLVDDVKSAVEWLLKEIEKFKERDIDAEIHESARKQYYKNRFAWLGKSERRHIDFEQGIMFALIEVESLIKKAFEDVMNG
ncbi:MAG: hypothetical protein ACTSVE_00145 [Candidatus Helarchaeota archaeon]